MTHYALASADGTIAIMQVAPGADINAEVAKFAAVNWPVISVAEIDPADIPADRSKRATWRLENGRVVSD